MAAEMSANAVSPVSSSASKCDGPRSPIRDGVVGGTLSVVLAVGVEELEFVAEQQLAHLLGGCDG